MFCLFCKNYDGLDNPCKEDKNIWDFQEVLECEHYKYNGECNDNQSN